MAHSGVNLGSDNEFRALLGAVNDRIDQLYRLVPGAHGGGSVAAPFTVGGLELNEFAVGQIGEYVTQTWKPFHPRIDQGVTTDIAYSENWSEFLVLGTLVFWNFSYTITDTGTAGSGAQMTMPVRPQRETSMEVGPVLIYDDDTATRHNTLAETTVLPDGTWGITFGAEGGSGASWGSSPSLALEPDDRIRGTVWYRHGLT